MLKVETRNLKSVLLTLLLSVGPAFGFEATMTVQPPLIQLNESATLRVEVRGAKNPQPPAVPNVPGLRISYTGQSSQMSWINGKSDSSIVYSYAVYPQQTGTFAIGPFDYTVQKESVSLSTQLKVVAGGTAEQAQSWSDLLFAKLTADRDTVYVQEPFGLILSVYSRQGVQLAGNISLTGMPETGRSDLKWQEMQPSRDVVNGTVYDVRRFVAQTRAMSSGDYEFAPVVTAQVAVPNPNNRSRDPFFSSFFDRVETRPVDLPVEKTLIRVKPLPSAGKPAGFSGAVGDFDFSVSAKPLDVHPGDPITLTLNISGNGNLDRVMMPPVPNGDRFRLFGDSVRKQEENAVQFEQVISPKSADATEIPSIEFSFFDTKAGDYKTIRSAPIPITVTATSNSTAQVFALKDSVVMPPPETPFATESDVQRIESALSSFWNAIRPWLWTVPAVLLVWLTAFFGRKLHRHRRKDTARLRRQKAPKAARQALRAAARARRQGNTSEFYDFLGAALNDYFGHRLNLSPGEIFSSAVSQALNKANAPERLIATVTDLFGQVEANRYGFKADPSPDAMNQKERMLTDILKQCEQLKF